MSLVGPGINSRASLLSALVRRELQARYRGTILGGAWPFIVQIAQLLVFTYLFGTIFHTRVGVGTLPPSPVAYGLWLFAGLVPWTAFVGAITQAASSVVSQPNLVKKVVFPLAILPLVPVLGTMIESLAGIVALLIFTATQLTLTRATLILIPLIALQIIFSSGIAYLLAATTVFYRDVVQALTPILLIFFYLTPIVYPVSQVPAAFSDLVTLNPIAIIVDGYRGALFAGTLPSAHSMLVLCAFAVGSFAVGIFVYRKLRPVFADVL